MTWANWIGAAAAKFLQAIKVIPKTEPVNPPTKTNTMIIDISHHNGIIDWALVAKDPQGISGAIMKATEGATGADKRLARNIQGCKDNGLDWGCYHFATWNNENEVLDAKQEAAHFIQRVQGFGTPTLPMVLDIESNNPIPYTRQEMIDFVAAFLSEVKAAGYETAIYASPGFLNSYLPANHPFKNEKLWVADYTNGINPVPGWTKYWLHQYTEKGKVQGIAGNVDLNRFVD